MAEYISREAALRALENCVPYGNTLWTDKYAARARIDAIPAADVVEVRHGEWSAKRLDNFRKYKVTCTVCSAEYIGNYDSYDEPSDFNYCPNCGAKMNGGEDA